MSDEPNSKWNVQVKFLTDTADAKIIKNSATPEKHQQNSDSAQQSKAKSLNDKHQQNLMTDTTSSYGKAPKGLRTWPSWFGASVLTLISLMPMAIKRQLASLLTWLYIQKIGSNSRHVKTAQINLLACFPELDIASRNKLLRDYFFTLMLAVFQIPKQWWQSKEAVKNSAKRIGLEPVTTALEKGEACAFLISHTVCLDAGLVALSPDFDMTGFYKPFNNPVLDWLIQRSRSRFGGKPIARGDGFREVIRRMKDGSILCYLCDEDYGPEASVFAPLFAHQKATLKMLPKITKLTKAKIFPMATYLNTTTGKYEIRIQPALENYPSGDEVVDAAKLNSAIEDSIRQDPTQYLWKLQLFRSCPHGKDSRYLQIARGELTAENI